jgi:hypothetical protein
MNNSFGIMWNPFLFPLKLIERLVELQERRQYNFYIIFIFCVFTGFVRGLEEALIFRAALKNTVIASYVYLYLNLGFLFTLVLVHVGRLEWTKVVNAVTIGIFLGIFPPIIDLLFNLSRSVSVHYGYHLGFFENAPWYFYAPKNNFPLGECIILWATVFFCSIYIWIKTKSVFRCLLTVPLTYIVILLHSIILPSTVHQIMTAGIGERSYLLYLKTMTTYWVAFWQVIFTVIIYFILRPALFIQIIKRIAHAAPFILISLLGAKLSKGLNLSAYLTAGMIGFAVIVGLVQNDYFDRRDDQYYKRKSVVKKTDLPFFNICYLLCVGMLFVMNNKSALAVILFFTVCVLYNYNFYRAKKYFPANIKIEGIWGASAFLSGMLVHADKGFNSETLIILVLVFGGWSMVSSLKDFKDVRGDKKTRVTSAYLFLMSKGIRLSRTHKIYSSLTILCFIIPLVWLTLQEKYLEAMIIWIVSVIPIILMTFKPPKAKWYEGILIFTGIYLLLILVFI